MPFFCQIFEYLGAFWDRRVKKEETNSFKGGGEWVSAQNYFSNLFFYLFICRDIPVVHFGGTGWVPVGLCFIDLLGVGGVPEVNSRICSCYSRL